ncbi:MAG: diaminopimelate decarboxylase [Oscillospiraceae bacterium]|nr:diaminopimelate decarboxylase [Oscillospiraceae bacterium]
MICENIGINASGHLTFSGLDSIDLAKKHGTPLYLLDEDRIRDRCRLYKNTMQECLGGDSRPLYAGKAACFKRMYEIMREEGLSVDLVSPGEIHTAMKAGYPMENAFFHGNNKTDGDIAYAIDCGVGCFVADGEQELDAANRIAGEKGVCQNMLLRLTPGIDPHTYDAVATGKVDSKFGSAIETGQAEAFLKHALSLPNLKVIGYHCHVGSQVFDEDGTVYQDAADIMLAFTKEMLDKYGVQPKYLNLGGGYGVRYTDRDPQIDIAANIRALAVFVKEKAESLGLVCPSVLLEPGRSIVADAGMTLYTAGTVKRIPGYKNYVSVDGGMTDNPRYALYGSKYTIYIANKATAEANFRCDVVGRCCESGDIIQPAVLLPEPERGDIIAVCTTGAYNYAMASNYNRIPRPPVVMLSQGNDYVAVRRETYDDLMKNDI